MTATDEKTTFTDGREGWALNAMQAYVACLEPTLRERAALYSTEQWKHILSADIRDDYDDPLYEECGVKFDEMVIDADACLEHAGLHAIGLAAFRRVMLDFVPFLTAHADAEHPRDLAKFREIARFREWCEGEHDGYDYNLALDWLPESVAAGSAAAMFRAALDDYFAHERLIRDILDQTKIKVR